MDENSHLSEPTLLIDLSSPRPKWQANSQLIPQFDNKILALPISDLPNIDFNTTEISPFKNPSKEPRRKCQANSQLIPQIEIENKILTLPISDLPNEDLNTTKLSPFKDPFEEVFVNAYFRSNKKKNSIEVEDKSISPDNVKTQSTKYDKNISPKEVYMKPERNLKNNETKSPKEEIISILQVTNEDTKKNAISEDIVEKIEESVNVLCDSKQTQNVVDLSLNHNHLEQITSVERIEISPTKIVESKTVQMHIKIKEEDSSTNKSTRNLIKTETTLNAATTNCDDSSSCTSYDFSTEESLKAVIAKRVNHCIQSALNNSLKSKTPFDPAKTLNRRSLSFVSQSTKNVKCDRLNKSFDQYKPANDKLISSEFIMESSNCTPIDTPPGEVSNMEDSVFLSSEKDLVFKEANKLARTFSKLAESFSKMSADSDSDDDLMTCQPRWMYADSSEDEEEKLRRDPALNIRVSLTNSMSKSMLKPDSDALSAYKSRCRFNSSEEERAVKRSLSAPKLAKIPALPALMPSVDTVKVKLDENSTKIKRSNKSAKQIPMKATIPIQSMKKDFTVDEGKFKNLPSPPFKRQKSGSLLKTPSKDTSQSGMCPVASSTPNKSNIVSNQSLSTSAIAVPPNKRHSLESRQGHKSRTIEAETVTRQRSNSASGTGIPTPKQDLQKISQKTSLLMYPLKPRSTSSLGHPRFTNSQVKSSQDKKTVATNRLLKANFNPRALNEVNSPKPNRVSGIANAITSFVTGKSKKMSASDKENRVPY